MAGAPSSTRSRRAPGAGIHGAGLARVPDGLAEPSRTPLYPQRFAEVMARGRPVAAGEEELPKSLDELAVGDATAREIGWIR